ncbi:WD40 repeat-like protein [Metschnikowia bicuspidata var. bicuspidata NRRL YB-4993]|uniref:WD40 repeat-like protein n=1 Tax=Metschnikowia bicuspidata var. bicuspidata NRRL YB-4993 TaxID=869754 RepID=A0A1A0H9F8_9ASCO|nr:WD40 repeat-like protein [Metschnikowia bicuspidata var. bicuspidata NRRL YB-4993]OBA20522.1 WD40 repeat-like protein [Metschnikowia bicuspidata var. bicuspidata NRRL YB-4993]
MPDFSDRWTKSMISGGNPSIFPGMMSLPAISSADGKHSIVCLSHQLRIYFLQTRQCIRTVDVDFSQALAVHLDPESENQIVVFTANEIFYVNWREKVDTPVVARQSISPPFEGLQSVFKVTTLKYFAAAKDDSQLLIYALDRETAAASKSFEVESVRNYATSADGHKLAVVLESGDVCLYDISALAVSSDFKTLSESIEATKEMFSGQNKSVTCITVSESGIIAIGNSAGVIKLIYGGSSTGKPHRNLRWHIDPVRSLSFSADEVYLVSGGNEKVLVFWHLDLDRTQFLPRLSGPIDCISVDKNRPDHYTVALCITEGPQPAHEILTILAVDLISRLSVSPVCPNFATPVRRAVDVARKNYQSQNDDLSSVRHDVTAPLAVHPTSKHLYFARGSAIQAYDMIRGEQAFVQHAVMQISTGRVRSERKVEDPSVSALAFSADGQWMVTFDSMPTLDFDNLMLKKDVSFALKFWQLNESSWLLALKIVDPHGAGIEVGAIVTPGGHTFTTVDKKGGIRVWKPRANHVGGLSSTTATAGAPNTVTQTVWTLRRANPPTATVAPVAACYSPDRSLLAVSHGSTVRIHEPELLHATEFSLPAMESFIESLSIVGTYLIIVSQRKMMLFDLVSSCETDLFAQMCAPGARNLVAVDSAKQLVAVAVNQYYTEPEVSLRGKVLIFRPDSIAPVFATEHSLAIASLVCTPSGFLFVDTDSRIGLVAPEVRHALSGAAHDDLSAQMSKMLVNAQATANILFARSAEESTRPIANDDSDKWTAYKAVDVAVLQPIFSNIEGVSLDSLFERVVRAVQ